MAQFTLDITFTYGWCVLHMGAGQESVDIENHWMNGAFQELVDSVDWLLGGKESVSCRWQHEVDGGNFVDLVADPEGGIDIAVHEFYYPDAETAPMIWSALRGDASFTTHVPIAEFASQFAAALRRIRILSVDDSGLIEDWGHPFPQERFELIESKAAGFGYQPKSRAEIVRETTEGFW